MVNYYKSEKGYYYKVLKNNIKKRISREEFLKKNKNKIKGGAAAAPIPTPTFNSLKKWVLNTHGEQLKETKQNYPNCYIIFMTPHLTDFIFTQHSIDLLYGFIREQNTPYFAQIEEKMQRTYEINEDLIPNISVVNPYDFYNDVLIPKHTEENVNNKRGHLTLLGDREHQNEYFPEYIEVMNRDHKLSEIVDNIARSNPHDMNFIYVLTCRPFYYQDEEINNYHLFRGIVPNSGTVNNQPVANHNAPLGGLINKYISTPFQPAAPGQFPPAAPPGQFPFAHAPINNNKMEGLINYVGTHNPTPNSLHDLLSQLPMSQ